MLETNSNDRLTCPLKKRELFSQKCVSADVVAHVVSEGNVVTRWNEIGREEYALILGDNLDPLLPRRVSINPVDDDVGQYLDAAVTQLKFSLFQWVDILRHIAGAIFGCWMLRVLPIRHLEVNVRSRISQAERAR